MYNAYPQSGKCIPYNGNEILTICFNNAIVVGSAMDALRAMLMVAIMSLGSLSGCFGEDESSGEISASGLDVSPDIITGGDWTVIKLAADSDMSVFVPYFVQDPGSMRAQNGTVFDLKEGDSVSINILFPPRNSDVFLLIGEYGRENWPIRAAAIPLLPPATIHN